jgi:CheY-like chemotaxis protein
MEAVGRLAGGVAHDFNNLITAIRGYAGFLLDDLEPGDARRDDVEEIVRASDRAATLTRQLLAFSRKQVLNVEVLDLGGVVRQMEKLLHRLIGEDVRLELDVAPELGTTLADAGQMEQVLMNLAVNARDAMPRGGTLTIGVRDVTLTAPDGRFDPRAPAGDYVELSVQDEGHGIPADVLPHLFEPFFTTKEKGKGTGLGLSTVYGIVRQSGGAIRVASSAGEGTRFEILLPRTASSRSADGAANDARAESAGETVLVVEDEPAVRTLTQRLLGEAGYRVLVAATGEEALAAALQESQIDLLLTDVVMPGMSGRDLAREFCRIRPRARVLYMSGYTDDVIAAHGLLEPGLSLLQKPFTAATLLEGVRATLEQAASLY